MIWFLALHISTLLIWIGALLYLPELIIATATRRHHITESDLKHDSIARFVFTRIATPAALLAIMSGTAVFLVDHTVDVWLAIKLTMVVGLVVCHTLMGVLIIRTEGGVRKFVRLWCRLLAGIMVVLIVAIIWTVLAKPVAEEVLLWEL